MSRHLHQSVSFLTICCLLFATSSEGFSRGGGRGGGGGGARMGGGGGARMGGGGGMSRPSPSISRAPSMSRPSAPVSRPSTPNISRPSTPNISRPSTPSINRPAGGISPGSRPGNVDFARPATRPSTPGLTPGTRPSIGSPGISQLPANRPGIGNTPGIGNNPGIANRPGVGAPGIGNRPGDGIANRPGAGQLPARPGAGNAVLPGLGNRPEIGNRPSQLPSRGNLQERRGDLENRLTNRDQWQDHRGDIREDWHNHYGNIYDRHDNWHHGCWNGNAGDWWHHMWDEHTALMAFGTTMWGLNRAAYAFGYWGYYNPWYTEPYPIAQGCAVDYSQPIAVESAPAVVETPATPAGQAPAPAPTPGMSDFDAARDAFYKKDYKAALAATNKALVALPNDPIIHEFRALVEFAIGNYKEAAAGLYSVLSVGPGWDWTTMSSLYPDQATYTEQLRKLEDYVRSNPKATDARFVLGYHYLTAGYKEPTVTQWQVVYKANPNDQQMKQLLLMVGGPEAIGASPAAETTTPESTVKIPVDSVVGQWSATSQGSRFTLDITKDGNFTWTYGKGSQVQTVKGVYALDGDTLALEPETGGTMLAQITPPANGAMKFAMLGAPPGDPGLAFTKTK